MTMKALVRTADNSLVRIDDFADNVGHKPGLALMDIEQVTVGTTTSPYTSSVTDAGAVVGGKWRITTTVADLAGAALATAKSNVVSSADLTLAEAFRWMINYEFAQARIATPGLLKSDFLAAITAAQTPAGGTPASQTPVTRPQMLAFLAGII
jgi:hypothetical protein